MNAQQTRMLDSINEGRETYELAVKTFEEARLALKDARDNMNELLSAAREVIDDDLEATINPPRRGRRV